MYVSVQYSRCYNQAGDSLSVVGRALFIALSKSLATKKLTRKAKPKNIQRLATFQYIVTPASFIAVNTSGGSHPRI